jgi:probable FeS assembly SUF system protein SufT
MLCLNPERGTGNVTLESPTFMDTKYITLTRDVQAVQIPSGETLTLSAGTAVFITQALGGTHTVVVAQHPGLYRIHPQDADALGKRIETVTSDSEAGPFQESKVWDELRTCYDPEIPVNIVDLGLIYDVTIEPEASGHAIDVKMTLTAPGCGMGPTIAEDARAKLESLPGVTRANVQLVWDPPWTPERISPEGKAMLGMA